MTEDNRPHTGHGIIGILHGVMASITERTGLSAYMEPTPQRASETSVLLVPKNLSFRCEGTTKDQRHTAWTAMLNMDLVLNGEGSGPEFLAEALQAGFNMALYLDSPLTVEYGTNMFATLSAEKSGAGRFFDNEEQGAMFHVYEEQWSGTLFFPVHAETPPPVNSVRTDDMRTIDMG